MKEPEDMTLEELKTEEKATRENTTEGMLEKASRRQWLINCINIKENE